MTRTLSALSRALAVCTLLTFSVVGKGETTQHDDWGGAAVLRSISENNLELKALATENKAAENERKGENAIGAPTIEYSPFYTKGRNGVASSELIVSEEFDFPTRYAQRRRQSVLEGRTAESAYEVRRREIMLEARLLCYDVIEQNQRLQLLRQRCRQNENIAMLFNKRMEAGDASALEYNKAQMEQMRSAQDLVEAEGVRSELLQRLQVMNAGVAVVLEDTVFPEMPKIVQPVESSSLPEVREAESVLAASQHGETMARQEWLPSLKVGYRRNTDDDTVLNGFMVGVAFPVFGTGSKAKAATQRRQSAELRLQEVRHQAEAEQRQALQRLQQLRTVMDHSDIHLLKSTFPLLEKALKHGQISALDYYVEYNDLCEKILQHIGLHTQYMRLYAQLNR